eukprot:m.184783 g.184783  ORF g.184783 m.184783 type:complete len:333 (+) comp15394_c0_seq1:611-1609(+)
MVGPRGAKHGKEILAEVLGHVVVAGHGRALGRKARVKDIERQVVAALCGVPLVPRKPDADRARLQPRRPKLRDEVVIRPLVKGWPAWDHVRDDHRRVALLVHAAELLQSQPRAPRHRLAGKPARTQRHGGTEPGLVEGVRVEGGQARRRRNKRPPQLAADVCLAPRAQKIKAGGILSEHAGLPGVVVAGKGVEGGTHTGDARQLLGAQKPKDLKHREASLLVQEGSLYLCTRRYVFSLERSGQEGGKESAWGEHTNTNQTPNLQQKLVRQTAQSAQAHIPPGHASIFFIQILVAAGLDAARVRRNTSRKHRICRCAHTRTLGRHRLAGEILI